MLKRTNPLNFFNSQTLNFFFKPLNIDTGFQHPVWVGFLLDTVHSTKDYYALSQII